MYECACLSTKRQLPHMEPVGNAPAKSDVSGTTSLDRTNYVPAERLRPALI